MHFIGFRHVPDKLSWSDEAKLKFQEALYTKEIKIDSVTSIDIIWKKVICMTNH